MTLVWNNVADNADLSGGSWLTSLPLTNMLATNLTKVARSVDLALASTQLNIALVEPKEIISIVVGPTNLSTYYAYKITWYSDEFTTEVSNTGWINPFDASLADPFDIPWESPYFWQGVEPFSDADRGIWLIHVFSSSVTAQYWKIEIDDQLNIDGYIQAGRLFIGSYWAPSINYMPENNGLSFRNATLESSTLRGGKHYWRRINPRVWSCKISQIPEGEAFSSAYDLTQQAGYDKEVFVIPDVDDTTYIQRRAFLATITQADPISQAAAGTASVGFTFEEIVQ